MNIELDCNKTIINKSENIELSIVVPVYNEVDNVKLLVESIINTVELITNKFELIIVDDGSTDGTVKALKSIVKETPGLEVITFRRNYGQTAALSAGFDKAKGNIIVTLDGDLQNDPADIPKLIQKINEGYDVVSGWRKNRQDTFINRKLPSMIANKLISKLTGVFLHDYGCSLKAYKKEIAKEIPLYGELHRFIPALASIEGAKIIEIPVNHNARKYGQSKYNILRTFKVVLDLMTVVFLRKFMTRPLHVFGRVGMLSFFTGILIELYLVCDKILFSHNIGTRPLLFLGILLILSGIQLFSTGIVAEILIRTYYESQSKPIYKIREVFNQKG